MLLAAYLCCIVHILHIIVLCIVSRIVFIVHYLLFSVQSDDHIVFIVTAEQCSINRLWCTVHCILFTVQCLLCSVYSIAFIVQRLLCRSCCVGAICCVVFTVLNAVKCRSCSMCGLLVAQCLHCIELSIFEWIYVQLCSC